MNKPTIPEVAPLVDALYASDHGTVGGHLHNVLDDGNLEDSSVAFCIAEAERDGCQPCLTLGKLLLRMSKTQRRKLSMRRQPPARASSPL